MGKLHHIECGCVDCTRMRNNTIEHLHKLLKHQMQQTQDKHIPHDGGIRVHALGEQRNAAGEVRTIIVLECCPEGYEKPFQIGLTVEAFTMLNMHVAEALLLLDMLSDDEPKPNINPRSN